MGGKPRIPGKRSLQVIERVRRQLEATDHELGSVGDFIDRFGAHDPDPNATTDRLHNLNRQRSRLARQLRRRIERLKQKQPGALEVWVAVHQLVWSKAILYFETHHHDDLLGYRTHVRVAREARAEWDRVLAGDLDWVTHNRYYLARYLDEAIKALR